MVNRNKNSASCLLPVRFPPKDDELFSSWLVRLAMAHIVKLRTFTKFVFPNKQIWNRDIDKSAVSSLIGEISEKTGIEPNRIFASMLHSLEGSLYEKHFPNGNLSWILPVGVYRLTRRRFGLQICPLCLSEDEEPYYRRLWRISWATVCCRHRIVLLDRCPNCKSPIIFHRGDMGWRNQPFALSMTRCSICGLYWTSQKVTDSLFVAHSEVIDFQKSLEKALSEKWHRIPGFGQVHSICFFNGLKHLLHVLSVSVRAGKFRQEVSHRSGLPLAADTICGERVRSFDYLPLDSRYRSIHLANWILEEWSTRICDAALAAETFSSALLPYNETAPFWYWLPVHEHLSRNTYQISEAEIWSALSFLEKKKNFILPMNLENLLGRNFFEYKPDKFIVFIYRKMRKFNETKERERLAEVRRRAKEIATDLTKVSKTKALKLSRRFRRIHSRPPPHFRKTQRMFDSLIKKYQCRERLKMARRMAVLQNASVVGEEFGVSPGIVRKWYRRYMTGGAEKLDDRSRSPRTFRHQKVFAREANWIRILHAKGLGLSEIKSELKERHDFDLSEGGLFRAMNRLKLVLPCSEKNRFRKQNRKRFAAKRFQQLKENSTQ